MIEAVTMVPPTSMRTWAVVVPFFTSTIFPLRTLRALSFSCESVGEDLLISARLREW